MSARARFLNTALALLGLATFPCSAGASGEASGAGGPAAVRPNLVLLTLDTTRADHLGAWGWSYAHTPNLDALAGRGTRFARTDTAAPITLPSHSTILTGLLPPHHGVRDNGTFILPEHIETLAERLRQAGYDTAAVVSAVVLARRHGLDQGFRTYDDDLGMGYTAGTEVSERQAENTTAAAEHALAGLHAPFFLWVHFYDPHEEYRPPTRFADLAKGPQRLYDGEIAYMDEQIGVLLGRLPASTVVVAVGDHGEMLGEHGETSHGLLLYRGARRVPLMMAGPGVPAGRVDDCLARTADVAPTLLQLAGVKASGLDGESLLPLADARSCARTSYSESFLPFFDYKWYPLRAMSNGAELFLQAPKSSLYSLDRDPDEAVDIAEREPKKVADWRERLQTLLAAAGETLQSAARPENVLTEEQRQRLASLGYLGGVSAGAVSTALPDPRSMTAIALSLHQAAAGVQQGRCKDILPDLQRIVLADPHNFPALSLAGECLRDTGQHEKALALFRRAAQENELSAVPIASIAGSLLKLGRTAEAEREYRHALTLDATQSESASNLARILRERGDRAGAGAVLDAAIAAGCHMPSVFQERGVLNAEAGRLDQASSDFREAARRSPNDPVPLENAARASYQLGRFRESAQLYQTLLRIVPDRLDLWKTLGAIELYQLTDRAAAQKSFQQALRLERDPEQRAALEKMLREFDQ
ncbi:MAG: sulfatase-like hydrolase/transferase [Acidobacteriota bacterium]